jgi:hypothetical protein
MRERLWTAIPHERIEGSVTLPPPSAPPLPRPKDPPWPFVAGCITLFVVNVALGLFNATGSEVSAGPAEHAGEFVGGLIGVLVFQAVIVGIGYGIARFVRRNKAPPRLVVVAFYALGLVLLIQGAGVAGRLGSATFTPEQRAGLRVTSDSIAHDLLGFSAPNPHGAFTSSPDLQHRMDSAMASNPQITAWALNSKGHGNVIIEATKFTTLSETKFRAYIDGFRKTAVRQADRVMQDSVSWTTRGEYRLAARVRGAFIRTRCLSRSRAGDNLIVCLQAASVDSTDLALVPEGLTLKAR